MSDQIFSSPTKAPKYALHRSLDGSVDSLPETERKHGLSCEGYAYLHIQVVPSGGANPAVSVLFWSEEASQFVPQHTALDYAAKGADTAWETTIAVRGRVVFVAVTSGVAAGQKCKVLVAGHRSGNGGN